MKILVVCDQGNNRSVTIAHHLKYWGHDVLPVGLKTNSAETLHMLCHWADRIIFTDKTQLLPVDHELTDAAINDIAEIMAKSQLWDVGPDIYPRPFNPELLQKVRRLMEEHKGEYKP